TEYGGTCYQVFGPQQRYETSSPYPQAPPSPWGDECRLHEDLQHNVRWMPSGWSPSMASNLLLPRDSRGGCHTQGVPAR
ncbi:hypothetical protein PSHT_11862, partial [Puccinia striiformis]